MYVMTYRLGKVDDAFTYSSTCLFFWKKWQTVTIVVHIGIDVIPRRLLPVHPQDETTGWRHTQNHGLKTSSEVRGKFAINAGGADLGKACN